VYVAGNTAISDYGSTNVKYFICMWNVVSSTNCRTVQDKPTLCVWNLVSVWFLLHNKGGLFASWWVYTLPYL